MIIACRDLSRVVQGDIILKEEKVDSIKMGSSLTFLCLIWGANWVAIKISLEGFPPLLGAAGRFLLAILALYIYVKWKRISLRLDPKELKFLLISAFLTYVIDYGLLFWGEQYISAGVASIFFSTFALFTAILSNFVFRSEPFSLGKFSGLTLGLLGIVIVFYDQVAVTRFSPLVILASVLVLVAAIGAAVATVIIKKYLSAMDHVKLSFHQMLLGTIMLIILSVIFEDITSVTLNSRILIAMVYMGVVASAMAFVIYYRLLKNMSAVSLSFIIYIIPIVALLTDYVVYGELLSFRSFIGMVVIFAGIWFSRIKRKKVRS